MSDKVKTFPTVTGAEGYRISHLAVTCRPLLNSACLAQRHVLSRHSCNVTPTSAYYLLNDYSARPAPGEVWHGPKTVGVEGVKMVKPLRWCFSFCSWIWIWICTSQKPVNGYKRDGTARAQKLFLYKASTSTSVFHVY